MNKTLRKQILDMAKKDQELRKKVTNAPDKELVKKINEIDRENTKKLKKIIKEHGYPTISLVGKKGSFSAWLLIQHADHDPKFQEKCLELIKNLNSTEVSKEDIAYLTDRVLVNQKKKQIFGTQFYTNKKGEFTYRPIKDMKNLEKRRKEYGLQPFKDYIKLMNNIAKRGNKK